MIRLLKLLILGVVYRFTELPALLISPLKKSLLYSYMLSRIYTLYCLIKYPIESDGLKWVVSSAARLKIDKEAKIVLNQVRYPCIKKPFNRWIGERVGIGLDWYSRFIPFSRINDTIIDLKANSKLFLHANTALQSLLQYSFTYVNSIPPRLCALSSRTSPNFESTF